MKAMDYSIAFLVPLQAGTTSLFNFTNRITSFMKYCAQLNFTPKYQIIHYRKHLYLFNTKNCP